MNTDLLKKLALMQHEGDEFFILDEDFSKDAIAYEGTEDAARESYAAEYPENEEGEQEEGAPTFEDWAADNLTEIEEYNEDDYGNKYMVLTDEEADEKWDESLDNYIEECIKPEFPDAYWSYFDEEAWKKDARMDGRGHSLSTYDGSENEEEVEGETFYIYRIN